MGEQAEYDLEQAMWAEIDDLFDNSGWPPRDGYDEETHWKQRDGKIIAIDDMEISHVRNTVRMCRRNNKTHMIPSRMLERLEEDHNKNKIGVKEVFNVVSTTI